MSNSPKQTDAVIQVDRLTVSFSKYTGMFEVLLSVRWIAWLVGLIPFLRHSLERKQILEDISFEVAEGSIFGIFGVNAAGKSTLAYCLCGLLAPRSGRVLVHGRDLNVGNCCYLPISKCSRKELYASFNAVENIRFVARLHGLNVMEALQFGQNLLDQLGVSRVDQKEMVERLSLGSKGKVALVCSLLSLMQNRGDDSPAPILLLDEPTIGFDVLSVETFFAALQTLRRAIPRLTVVLATNDPREMAHCDEHIAIVEKHARHDEELLSHLKTSVAAGRKALRFAARLIGMELTEDGNGHDVGNVRISRDPSSTPLSAFLSRTMRDITRFPTVSAMVVMSLVVPNLMGLFASAESRGIWRAMVTMIFGLFVSMIMRDGQRFMDRERNWYCVLETLLLSPVSRWSHFRASAITGGLYHLFQVMCVGVLLTLFLWVAQATAVPAGFGPNTLSDWAGLAALMVVMFVAVEAMGAMVTFLPFMLRPISAFFIVNVIPGLTVALSGIYFPASSLPWGIRHIAYANPATFGAVCLDEFFGLNMQLRVPAVDAVQNFIPISYGWASLLVLASLALLYALIASFFFSKSERLLRRIGRLRNV